MTVIEASSILTYTFSINFSILVSTYDFIDIYLFKLLSNLLKQLHEVSKSLNLIQKLNH